MVINEEVLRGDPVFKRKGELDAKEELFTSRHHRKTHDGIPGRG